VPHGLDALLQDLAPAPARPWAGHQLNDLVQAHEARLVPVTDDRDSLDLVGAYQRWPEWGIVTETAVKLHL